MTLRKGKEVDNKMKIPMRKTTQVVHIDFEDSLPMEKDESSLQDYILNEHFSQRLAKANKKNSIGEIIDIFK